MRSLPVIIDIETAPLPERVGAFLPEKETFNPHAVKLGLLGPEKAAEKIAKEEAKHDQAYEDKVQKAHEKAALVPETARVLCIGCIFSEGDMKLFKAEQPEHEARMIKDFFDSIYHLMEDPRMARDSIMYWGGTGRRVAFDHIMLARRAWMTGATLPDVFRLPGSLMSAFHNLTADWLCEDYQGYFSLNKAAIALDLFRRHDSIANKDVLEVKGESFAEYFLSDSPDDKEKAINYVKNDLKITYAVADAMNLTR